MKETDLLVTWMKATTRRCPLAALAAAAIVLVGLIARLLRKQTL